eukprot:15433798-Alexandrium_andersonii.AAC.1
MAGRTRLRRRAAAPVGRPPSPPRLAAAVFAEQGAAVNHRAWALPAAAAAASGAQVRPRLGQDQRGCRADPEA